ncbi:FAD-dependent oxidoreductase [Stomatohabitans albus]|uniref:FAD-dependent oxidoreductase n=1 Tax=Stomatohabitans albus TaxID=3110766 RepID=UPI00300C8F65
MSNRIAIIGAGAAGLSCAATLTGAGLDVTVFEAQDRVGGRMGTDHLEGFTLDHGFQVLMTGYPSVRRLLDLKALDLRPFEPGALIYDGEKYQRLVDPFGGNHLALFGTLRARIPTMVDKVQIARMKLHLTRSSVSDLLGGPVESTRQVLRHRWGFSDRIIAAFFEPFLGSYLYDESLQSRSSVSLMALRAFFIGQIALPGSGMAAVAQQLATGINDLRLVSPVDDLNPLLSEYDAVVVATEAAQAYSLLEAVHQRLPGLTTSSNMGMTLYFASRQSPFDDATILVNGVPHEYVTSVSVPSMAAPSYSPTGWHLIAVNIVGDQAQHPIDDVIEPALGELRTMMGDMVDDWRFLRGYRAHCPDTSGMGSGVVQVTDRLFACGDHRDVGGLEAALFSGQKAADGVLAQISV